MTESASKKNLPSISNAEWEVIQTLWDNGPLAARDVFARLPAGHKWAYKTVKTLLARLVAKGAVDYEQIGNSYLYRAACAREEVTRKEVKGFVDRVLGGSLFPVLAHFIEERGLSDEEADRLRDLFEERKRGGERRKERQRGEERSKGR